MELILQDVSGSKTTEGNDTQKGFGIASEVFSRAFMVKRKTKACKIRGVVVLTETIKSVIDTWR